MTNGFDLRTTIHAPRADVFDFLRDVEGYGAYTEHVREVVRRGDGGPGTEYDVVLSWWILSYALRVRLTGLDPPGRIDWRVVEDVDAHGAWHLEPTTVDDPTVDHATRVTLSVRYDPRTADEDALSLPRFVPLSAVFERLRPVVEREAKRILDRVVADLEGEPRRATLDVAIRD